MVQFAVQCCELSSFGVKGLRTTVFTSYTQCGVEFVFYQIIPVRIKKRISFKTTLLQFNGITSIYFGELKLVLRS